MNNQELMQKMNEEMKMRGFSPHTKDSYERKAKSLMKMNGVIMEVTNGQM